MSSSRLLHVDLLKGLAAQVIVLHHLSVYGPVAESLRLLLPAVSDWLFDYGRMAVQVFLVIGGFLSARGLAPAGVLQPEQPGVQLWRRYLRLMLPFMAAVLLTLMCSALAAPWLPELVPASVSAPQLLSHALLLHGVLDQESLTVGAWYVAVDLQLFALLLALLWLARTLQDRGVGPGVLGRTLGPLLVLAAVLISLLGFNRWTEWDDWAPYFFGSYGLGALVHWMGRSSRRRAWLLLLAGLVLLALMVDFRERIALALVTALLLAALQSRHDAGQSLFASQRAAHRLGPWVAQAGNHAYALFLVHFPVCLLVNALFDHVDPEHPSHGLWVLLAAWALSNAAALPFYRWVEIPASRMRLSLSRAQNA